MTVHARQFRRRKPGPRQRERLKRGALFLLRAQRAACAICGGPMVHGGKQRSRHGHAYTIEHVTPMSRGGRNTADNIRLTHARCNQNRGSRDVCWYPLPCYRPQATFALRLVLGATMHSRFREVSI